MIGRARIFLLLLFVATQLAAQQSARAEGRTTVRGVVVDALNGDPLPNTMIRLVDDRRGVLADSLGRFVIPNVRIGTQLVAVKQYGYEELDFEVDFEADNPSLRIELEPGPVALQGFDVVADRLAVMKQRMQSRRNAAPVSVRVIDQERLNRSAARDMVDFLNLQGVQLASCATRRGPQAATSFQPASSSGGSSMSSCVLRRGQAVEPTVYIDEARTIWGLDELAMYKPYEMYLVEVYSNGGQVRAYTHNFMERMARRLIALIHVGLWFDR
ncbi:MAG: carboxypeptidase-like regulatory domain-containing protein [Gemmatimonadetes bacterium]|nr:carboxypeptidase-like regulatory domain-containing protein [Gemmatimonadota bacterium]